MRYAQLQDPWRAEEAKANSGSSCGALIDFYHNFSRLLGVDSLTSQQVAEIENELRQGFETGVLRPPPIEIVPFEKAVNEYSRVAAGQAKAKQVLSFDWGPEQKGNSEYSKSY